MMMVVRMRMMKAAALTGPGLCLTCVHRLCGVVWRPQAALFSSTPPDRKLPRRTHVKKAKLQPAVDVAKLLEQLFSQRRPSAAPPAARKAKPAKASSRPTNPPTTSSVKVSSSGAPPLSEAEPVVSVLPAASSVSDGTSSTFDAAPKSSSTNPEASFSSEAPQQSPLGFTQDLTADGVSSATVYTTSASPASTASATSGSEAATAENQTKQTKVETPADPEEPTAAPVLPLLAQVMEEVENSSVSAATVESLVETTVEPPVEASLPPVEAFETTASGAGPVEPGTDATVITAAQNNSGEASYTSTVEPSIEPAVEPSADTSTAPLETLEVTAAGAEGAVEPTAEAEADKGGVVNASHDAKEEPLIEPTVESSPAVETLETKAAVERPVEPTADATVDAATEDVRARSIDLGVADLSHTATVEPWLEPTVDPSVESGLPPVEALQTRASVAEAAVETSVEAQAARTNSSDTATVEPSIEPAVEPSADTSPAPLETLEVTAAGAEGAVEPTVEAEADKGGVVNASHDAKEEPLIEPTVEPTIEAALVQNAHRSTVLPLNNEAESPADSCSGRGAVDDQSEQRSLESVTLRSAQASVASLETEEQLLVQTGNAAEHTAAAGADGSSRHQSEILNEVLSDLNSLSEDLQELEGETGALVEELLCSSSAVLSAPLTVNTSSASGGDRLQEEEEAAEAAAVTLESVTLAEVLRETSRALEKEADVPAEEERREVKVEDDVSEDTTEAETSTLDSVSEAADVTEAEAAVLLEAMLGSEQGPRQPPGALELGPAESGGPGGAVLEAMSLESVTLAEVEASLGNLENESLGETTSYLEHEAEVLAGERRMEEDTASEEATRALSSESLSLPEADPLSEDLQTDALMEQLLFTLPGHVAAETEAAIGPDVLDATDDAAAAGPDDFAAAPAREEALLGEELMEEDAQAEVLGSEEGAGTHTDLDPVQRLFLEKIREYNNMRRSNGGPVEAEPDYQRLLSEETAKLQRLHGGGDLSSFPQFTFTEPKTDQDSQ